SPRRNMPAEAITQPSPGAFVPVAARPQLDSSPLSSQEDYQAARDALEEQRIREALQQTAGNQTKAAKLLGMSRRTLVSRLDKYGIDRPRKK
ncbi:MAG: helix-turn-helix domain-containing protein, partial [Polyangiaceae bacterium]